MCLLLQQALPPQKVWLQVSSQLDRWRGSFGVEYLARNQVDWRTRVATLRRLIPGDVEDVLEVGCSKGHNLLAIRSFLGEFCCLRGVEPGAHARAIARSSGLAVTDGDIYSIPHTADLAFTCGVLIHVPPDRIDEALTEVHRVARRYLLAIEYHADEDTEVEYRGLPEMLWKRDYGTHYQRLFPDLELIGEGALTVRDGFAGDYYWLLKK
jgi:SAM-dependent methyltransferase